MSAENQHNVNRSIVKDSSQYSVTSAMETVVRETFNISTDLLMWEAAKCRAAVHLEEIEEKKKGGKKSGFFQKFRRSKSDSKFEGKRRSKSDPAVGTPENVKDENSQNMLQNQDMVASCPLMRCNSRGQRKISICEKDYSDRQLVYYTLKFYRQASVIHNSVVPF